MTTASTARTFETTLKINAPVDDVWTALTTAEGLENWFPLSARVTPGKGGVLWTAWGETFAGEQRIEIWEPNRHLRTSWMDVPSDAAVSQPMESPGPMAVDYFLSPDGKNGTTLRLVHSGFGEGAAWDEMYDGISRGWPYELASLRNYLEHHRGRMRRVSWVRGGIDSDTKFNEFMGPDYLNIRPAPATLKPGDACTMSLPCGGEAKGRVIQSNRTHFSMIIENLDHALFYATIENCFGPRELITWFATWTEPQQRVNEMRDGFIKSLGRLCGSERIATH
ncbi:MAG: SRPBCC domain-containing protein [Planctomycetota bacterium]|nr:SRPBCC domain-containing protein [Planctomycetota bacterium]